MLKTNLSLIFRVLSMNFRLLSQYIKSAVSLPIENQLIDYCKAKWTKLTDGIQKSLWQTTDPF